MYRDLKRLCEAGRGGVGVRLTRVIECEHDMSLDEIVNGKIRLYGEGWRSNRNHCIEYDPDTESFTYSQGWNTLSASDAREIAPGIVRFNTPAEFMPKAGNTLTVRDIIRDQVGLFDS